MDKRPEENIDESFIRIIEEKVLFWWERHGIDYLAVTELTLATFKRQDLSEHMRNAIKKRTGHKSKQRRRQYNNVMSQREVWKEDNQAIYNYPAFVFTISGKADFHVGDYVIECPANHFLFFRDNVPRPLGNKAHLEGKDILNKQCDVLWFFMPPGAYHVISYICHSKGENHWSDGYHIIQRKNVVQAFEIFVEEIQEKEARWKQTTYSAFRTFLLLFLRELKEGRFLNTRPTYDAALAKSPIERAKEYIESYLHQPLTSEYVASKVYMSRKSFMDHFKQETGQTFHEFLTERRMERAQLLLGRGNWSIDLVSKQIGLKPTRFRAQFKAKFQMTPSQFRHTQIRIAQKR